MLLVFALLMSNITQSSINNLLQYPIQAGGVGVGNVVKFMPDDFCGFTSYSQYQVVNVHNGVHHVVYQQLC